MSGKQTNISRLKSYIKSVGGKITLALGIFEIKKDLGNGGNSVVSEAIIYGKTVAIKFLTTNEKGDSEKRKIQRFLSEYFHVITLNDTSSIVRYIDYDVLKFKDSEGELEIPIIIMKKYASSLAKITAKDKDKFLTLFDFLIKTIGRIHKQGITHRDIKPENILMESGEFFLADFGIASYNPQMFTRITETGKGERIANRLFSAPEQEEANVQAHPTMDIYAIGQVLQWYATSTTHRGTSRKKITSVFPELIVYDHIIEKCLAQEANKRFQSISEIEEFVKNSNGRKNAFIYLKAFHKICTSSFPNNPTSILHYNERSKIDRFLNALMDRINEFDKNIWWVGEGRDNNFTLIKKDSGIWKFEGAEFDFTDIWIHYDNRTIYNDFVLLHFQKGKHFQFDGATRIYDIIVDDKYQISYSEKENGYAEIPAISEEPVDLSKHQVEFTERQENDGYLFIGTYFNCIIQDENRNVMEDFIDTLLWQNRKPTLDELKDLKIVLRKNIHLEVKNQF